MNTLPRHITIEEIQEDGDIDIPDFLKISPDQRKQAWDEFDIALERDKAFERCNIIRIVPDRWNQEGVE